MKLTFGEIIWLVLFLFGVTGSEIQQSANSICPKQFKEKYIKFHESQFNTETSAKFLVYVPSMTGFTDNLCGLMSSYLAAMLTNRTIQITSRKELPSLTVAFDTAEVNWKRDIFDSDWLIEPLNYEDPGYQSHKIKIGYPPTEHQYKAKIIESKEYFAVYGYDAGVLHDMTSLTLDPILGNDAHTTFIAMTHGITLKMFKNYHYRKQLIEIGWTRSNIFGCLFQSLFKPKDIIFQKLHEEKIIMTSTDSSVLKIGIHIRVGDHAWMVKTPQQLKLEHYQNYFKCAEDIEKFSLLHNKYSKVIWYLLSDSKHLRSLAKSHYGDKLLTNLKITPEHSGKEAGVCGKGKNGWYGEGWDECEREVTADGLQVAVGEWWLLSQSQYFVISKESSYGRTAAFARTVYTEAELNQLFRNNEKRNVYTVDNRRDVVNVKCGEEDFTSMDRLAEDWKGL